MSPERQRLIVWGLYAFCVSALVLVFYAMTACTTVIVQQGDGNKTSDEKGVVISPRIEKNIEKSSENNK